MQVPKELLCPLPEGASLIYSPTLGVTLTVNPSQLTVSFKNKTLHFVGQDGKFEGTTDLTKFLAKDTFDLFLCRLELLQYLQENPIIVTRN